MPLLSQITSLYICAHQFRFVIAWYICLLNQSKKELQTKNYIYLHSYLYWCSFFLYVDLGFCLVFLHLILKDSLHLFYYGEIHIKLNLPFKLYSSVALTAFTMLLNVVQPSWPSSPSTFSSPQKETLYPLSSHSPFPHLPHTTETTNLLSVPRDLPILCISHKWNHTTPFCVWLPSLSIIFSKFIYVVVYISTFFLLLKSVFSWL